MNDWNYPSDWDEKELADVAEVNPESLDSTTLGNFQFHYIDISSVTKGVIDWTTVTRQVFRSSPSRARRVVRPLDVLLSTVRPGLQSHAFADWSDVDGFVCSTGFAVLRANEELEPCYLHQLVFHEIIARQLYRLETGSNYPAVNESDIRHLICPIPSDQDEQRLIAAILDTVDDAIRATEQLIAKLKQVRAGLLHDLLTYGIDDNGDLRDPVRHPEQFKPSALGLIPRTWEIIPALQAFSQIVDCPHYTPKYLNDGILVARTMFVKEGTYDVANSSRVTSEEYQRRVARLEPNAADIIMTREAPVGEAFVIPNDMQICLGQRVALLRPILPRVNPYYVLHQIYFGHIKNQIDKLIAGTTNPHLNMDDIRDFQIPLPTEEEQNFIASIVTSHDERIHREESTKAKLRLLKHGLMDDLLTGNVRVTALLARKD